MASFTEDVSISGNLRVTGTIGPPRARTELALESLAIFGTNFTDYRVWDALATNLPGTAATDDLAIAGSTTYGTDVPYVTAGDLKAAGSTTRRLRFTCRLPPEYDAGGVVKIRVAAGMKTTVADTTCTVDVEAFKSARDGLKTGSDLVSTSATSMNSTTFANIDFTLTATTLSPGDELDVRVSIACNDAATVTAVTPAIGAIDLLCDIRG